MKTLIFWRRAALLPALLLNSIALSNMNAETPSKTETAVLGGGCFWCVEAVYHRIDGVVSVESGYAGGHVKNPTYKQVITGKTGHAEVVKITYDPDKITYDQVIGLFWEAHDPTTLNRQGADVGPQYRSIILYENDAQKQIAETSKVNAAANFDDPIVTEIVPLRAFYMAEGYHQDYYENNSRQGYCTYVIKPKLKKLGLDVAPDR